MVNYDKKALKRHLAASVLKAAELAARIHMTHANISYLARGMTVPKATTLAKIATALDVPIESFFRVSEMQQKQRQPGGEHHGN